MYVCCVVSSLLQHNVSYTVTYALFLFSALYAKFTLLFSIDIAALPIIGFSYGKVNITSLFIPLHMFTYIHTNYHVSNNNTQDGRMMSEQTWDK
jgi:hypothetical protein